MRAREYIEHQYIPWILFLDKRDTIKHFVDGKESYLCELYNHISKEFKALERYELFMFRVEFLKQATPLGLVHIIAVKTPEAILQDTAGTLCKAANIMMENGARSVRAIVSHGVMSGKACENVMASALEEIVFSDSIPFDTTRCPKVRVLSIADLFADTITRIQDQRSISEQYLM